MIDPMSIRAIVKDIPGQWITVFVGGAVFIYIVGQANVNETVTTFSNDTVGLGLKTIPGGWAGFIFALAGAGAFLNEHSFGKIT